MRLLDSHTPTIITLDLRIPGSDGVVVLRELAARGIQAQLIIISGMDMRTVKSTERLAISHGLRVLGSLRKPFSVAELQAMFARHDGGSVFSEDDILLGLRNNEFFLQYQPKYSLRSGKLAGAEALARWKRPNGEVVQPAHFIPQIEASLSCLDFTLQILRSAAQQRAAWARSGYEVTIAVNIGAKLIRDLDLPDRFADAVQSAECSPSMLVLELTDAGVMTDAIASTEILTRLRVKGFGLAMDDFGTGYSSMLHLHRMPFNEIKIDRSFVSDLGATRDSATVIRSVINLGHNMGIQVCAEGVETRQMHDRLTGLDCDLAQGFLYGKPVSAQFANWSANNPS